MMNNMFRAMVSNIAGTMGQLDPETARTFAASLPTIVEDAVRDLDEVTARAVIESWLRDFISDPRRAAAAPAIPVAAGAVVPLIPAAQRWPAPVLPSSSAAAVVARRSNAPCAVAYREFDSFANDEAAALISCANEVLEAPAARALCQWAEEPTIASYERDQRRTVVDKMLAHLEPSTDGTIRYRGNLVLHLYTCLTSLPANLWVSDGVSMSRCNYLTALPAGLRIRGGLSISECPRLLSLPDDLQVNDYLSLVGCTGLSRLRSGLRVNGNLCLPAAWA